MSTNNIRERNDLYIDSNSGVKTDRDNLFYDSNREDIKKRFQFLLTSNHNKSFIEEYNIEDSGSYKITSVIKNIKFEEKFIQKSSNGNVMMTIESGINRELLGWIYQWMYNVKIIEPQILIDLYRESHNRIKENLDKNKPFVYKNIFEPK